MITHIVMPGETYESIAALYGVDVSRISRQLDFGTDDPDAAPGRVGTLLPGDRVTVNTSTMVEGNIPAPGTTNILNTSGGGAGGGTGTQTEVQASTAEKLANGGYVTFHVLTADGPAQVPVFLSAGVFNALYNSPLWAKYGLGQPEPQVQIGLSQVFLNDAKSALGANDFNQLKSLTSPLNFFKEVTGPQGQLPPLTPEMMATGIMWAQDPISGEFELIDTKPLYGPSLSSFKFSPLDPNNPAAGGTWQVVPDLAMEGRSMFEGVPTSVEPWLQLALDNGGDYNVVPEGPARAWVKYLLDQTIRSSSRPPSELPFGIGLPNFPGNEPGTTVPNFGTPINPLLPKTPSQIVVPNERPAPITQTQQPGYYDIPADPNQPVTNNPLQQQNGWVLGADGRWRATNPLTGQQPNSTPWVPSNTITIDANGNIISNVPNTAGASAPPPPPQGTTTPQPSADSAPAYVHPTPTSVVSSSPPPAPAPSPAPTTSSTIQQGPNGWTYNTETGVWKGPDPFKK